MMYDEFKQKIVKYASKKDASYTTCSISYDYYKDVVEPCYMRSKYACADAFCKACCLIYVD